MVYYTIKEQTGWLESVGALAIEPHSFKSAWTCIIGTDLPFIQVHLFLKETI